MDKFRQARLLFVFLPIIYGSLAYGVCTEVNPGEFVCDTAVTEAVTSNMSGALFTKTGIGVSLLQGTNTFTTSASLNAGEVFLQTQNNLTGDIFLNGGFVASGNTLSLSNNITANGGGFDVDYSGAAADNGLALTGALNGSSFDKKGTGVLTLMTTNLYAGAANINNGGVIADTSVFQGNVSVAAPATENDSSFFALVQDNNGTFTGNITGGGDFIKDGAGVVTLTGANSIQTTDLYAGALSISSGSNLSGDINMIGGELQTTADLTLGALGPQTIYLDNDITVTKGFNVAAGTTLTIGGGVTLSGGGTFYKDGAGTLYLNQDYSQDNYMGNTDVRGGTLEISDGGVLGAAGSIVMLNGAGTTLLVDKSTTIDRQVSFQTNGVSFNVAAGADVLLTQNTRGIGALNKDGNGTLTMLGGTMTQSGGAFINAGTLQGDSNSLAGVITDNATLNFLQSSDGTFLGTFTGAGTVNKYGAGVLSLTGAYNFTGSLNVLEGGLRGDTDSFVTDISTAAGARVIFNQDFDGEYKNVISGGGDLVKEGTNVLKLSGANTYTGNTIINDPAGILIDSDTALGAPSAQVVLQGGNLSVDKNAALTTGRNFVLGTGPNFITVLDGGDYTIDGDISGTSFVKLGAGVLTLDGANTHSDGTQISQGTLAVNSAAALGTGLLAVTGGVFKPLADMEFDSNIYISGMAGFDVENGVTLTTGGYVYGGGTINKLGGGTLDLGQYNSYTGGLKVDAGTVNGDADSILGYVTMTGGTLNFNQNTDGYYYGNIDAAAGGVINKNGSGMLIMEGDGTNGNTLNVGAFNVTQGNVLSYGIMKGAVNVSNGASLMYAENGGGTVNAAGAVYFDNSKDLTFAGNINISSGGLLGLAVTEGASTKLTVADDGSGTAGNITAAAGSTLDISATGVFKTPEKFEIMDYSGAFADGFSNVTVSNNSRLLAVVDVTNPGAVYVVISRLLANYENISGATYNQRQIAAALDRASAAPTADVENILNKIDALSPPGQKEALTQAGGLIYANIFSLNSFGALRDNAYMRLNAGKDGQLTNNIWLKATGNYFDAKANENSAELYNFSAGSAFGFDKYYGVADLRLGFAASYARQDLKHNKLENLDGDEFQFGGYMLMDRDAFDFKTSAGLGYRDSYVTRHIAFAGRTAKANVKSASLNADAEFGVHAADLGIFTLRPFAGVSASEEKRGAFNEAGADSMDLTFNGDNAFSAEARAGLGLQKRGAFSYYLDGVVRQSLARPDTTLTMFDENFTVRPYDAGASYGARLGVSNKFSDLLSLFADGGADFAKSSKNLYLSLGVRSYW